MYNLLKVDEFLLPDHHYLTDEDRCFFLMEYTPGLTDKVKSVIMNFKKSLEYKGQAHYVWKAREIDSLSNIFRDSLPEFENATTTLVPVPPSKSKSHPYYDDRMIQLLTKFSAGRKNCTLKELLYINEDMPPSHEGHRLSPNEIIPYLRVNEDLCDSNVEKIILFDDVLTTGAHFKACQIVLQPHFPKARISGMFIARSLH